MNSMGVSELSLEESLALVLKQPLQMNTIVLLRKSSIVPLNIRGESLAYIEIRGNSLVLYPVSDALSVRSNADLDQLERVVDKKRIVQESKPENVTVLSLKSCRFKVHPSRNSIQIKSTEAIIFSAKRRIGAQTKPRPLELRFPSASALNQWLSALCSGSIKRNVGLSDFELIKLLGKGSGGQVFKVKDIETGEILALKVIEKAQVTHSPDSYRHAVDERLVMELACDHPYIVKLLYAFQTELRLYLVTEYCAGGDLFEYMKTRRRPLPERIARRVLAQVILALEHIHSLGVIYRDLKLENILLDENARVRLADFGLSKLLQELSYESSYSRSSSSSIVGGPTRSNTAESSGADTKSVLKHNLNQRGQNGSIGRGTGTFCGTREYVSPEMLTGNLYGQSVDIWAMGVLLYEIVCGRTPFHGEKSEDVYDKIEKAQLRFPPHLSQVTVDFLRKVLHRDVSQRLGSGPDGIQEVKRHPFFEGLDWEELYALKSHEDDLKPINTSGSNPVVNHTQSEIDAFEKDVPVGIVFDLEVEKKTQSSGMKKDAWGSLLSLSRQSSQSKKSMIAGYGYTSRVQSDLFSNECNAITRSASEGTLLTSETSKYYPNPALSRTTTLENEFQNQMKF